MAGKQRQVEFLKDERGEYAKVELTRGLFMVVDFDDYELVKYTKWAVIPSETTFYAQSHISPRKLAHRVITDPPAGYLVDHEDGNGLNNRRYNLRICTLAQNNQNSRIRRKNRCGFKGVVSTGYSYRARIGVEGKKVTVGYFPSPELAAKAYDAAAIKYHGEFARVNFPEAL